MDSVSETQMRNRPMGFVCGNILVGERIAVLWCWLGASLDTSDRLKRFWLGTIDPWTVFVPGWGANLNPQGGAPITFPGASYYREFASTLVVVGIPVVEQSNNSDLDGAGMAELFIAGVRNHGSLTVFENEIGVRA
jgi:hypothetical protein